MSEEQPKRIDAAYLLVLNIALVADGGRFWADPLWHKDLLLHLVAVERLTLACPVERRPPPKNWLPIADSRIAILPLPPVRKAMPLDIPLIAWRLWHAIGTARIVHTGVAGWPFPLGWIAAPITRLRRRFLMVGVESSFWRVAPGLPSTSRERSRAAFFERANRLCVDAADLTFFTTEEYRDSLLRHPRGPSHITPATWVDIDQLIGREALDAAWAAKDGRMLFAGRLTAAKGVAVLIEALETSHAKVDLIGEGDMLDAVRTLAARHPDRVRLLDSVPYGPAFSALLDRYAAIVVPTLSGEQPRVLFDAYSRGVPAIASDTSGNRQLVRAGIEGVLVPAGDATALRAALDSANLAALAEMGRRARATMGDRTHEAMHRHRARIIAESFRG